MTHYKRLVQLLISPVLIAASLVAVSSPGTSHASVRRAAPPTQKVADPSYFYPGSLWSRLNQAFPTASIAIINPDSGPNTKPDCSNANANYVKQVKTSEAAGLTVLGYVDTNYTKVPLATAESNADIYYHCYKVHGIFFDEATTACANVSYYKSLYAHVGTFTHHLVIINPGTQTNKCYLAAADIILNFENNYTVYKAGFTTPAWVKQTPASRFWQLVYHATTTQDMKTAVSLSKKRHAGYVYVTPDNLPNPWDTLPAKPYWHKELAAARS